MSDERKYTERDMTRAKRDAAKWGAAHNKMCIDECLDNQYPLPKVTRPRVMLDSKGDSWRIVNGCFEFRWKNSSEWYPCNWLDASVLQRFAALLGNPTEEVEEDA